MCGRYVHTRTADELVSDFHTSIGRWFEPVEADWNMAPTKSAPVLVSREKRRELATARWGLVPSWAKDLSIGARMINARMETVAEKPAFRDAFRSRRAIVPVDGYYEWVQHPGVKQPWYISSPGGLALAGLHEWWRRPDRSWQLSFTILTTAAHGDDGRLHDRAPLAVPHDVWDDWLSDDRADDLLAELVPATPGRLAHWPVDRAVGNVANNGPDLIEPVAESNAEPVAE